MLVLRAKREATDESHGTISHHHWHTWFSLLSFFFFENKHKCTFLHISIQNLIKKLLLDSRWQVLDVWKVRWVRWYTVFASSFKPNCTQYWEQQSPNSNDTQRRCSLPFHSLLTFCHWHTVQHKLCSACCLSVCIEPCAHRARTLVAILLLNSEWHRHCRKDRGRIKRERCPAAGSGPDTVHKEILGISFKRRSEACIIFDPGNTESEYIWLP